MAIDSRIFALSADEVVDCAPADLAALVRENGLVLARAAMLSPQKFGDLCAKVGQLVDHPFLPESPQKGVASIVRGADGVNSFIYGGAWHQNLCFLTEPPDITALSAQEISDPQNFTAFIDCCEVAPWLSDGLSRLLRASSAIHSAEPSCSDRLVGSSF